MINILQVLTLILVVLAMVPALAHALELPGKLRLPKDAYVAVQTIYYPGFTLAGIAEPVAILSAIIVLVLMPRSNHRVGPDAPGRHRLLANARSLARARRHACRVLVIYSSGEQFLAAG
jgi:hypothetical protein